MDIKIIIVIGIAAVLLAVVSIAFRQLMLRQKKHLEAQAEQKIRDNQFCQELLKAQLEIQEQSVKHISQEIHDNIGQTLSLAKLNLNTLTPENATEKVNLTKDLLTRSIADLRSLSRSLHADAVLAAGFIRAVELELEQLEKTGSLSTSFQTNGAVQPIPQQKELILFRIVQEAINNTVQHAEASSIQVQAQFSKHNLALSIADDGKGFDLSAHKSIREMGVGLRRMYNRVQLMKGHLDVQSHPAKGTTIHINIPV